MSRPQYNNNAGSQSNYAAAAVAYQGQGVVNGGLIDFQDNNQRGVPSGEYAVTHGGVAAFPPGVAAPATLHTTSLLAANAHGGGNCFSGPPSFLHVNGTTYRPVEPGDPLFVAGGIPMPATLQEAPTPQTVTTAQAPAKTATVNTKILSEAELNRIVDDRVRERVVMQVNGYLNAKPRALSVERRRDTDPMTVGSRHRHTVYDRVDRIANKPNPDDASMDHAYTDREALSHAEPRVERAREDSGSRYHAEPRVERAQASGGSRYRHESQAVQEKRGHAEERGRSIEHDSYSDDPELMVATDRVRHANASMSRHVSVTRGRTGGMVW